MKGRMRPYLPELTIRDYNTYQWYQRGVRRQLYTTYGLYSCYGLRYNGVLFAVLADSLAGRPATCKRMREPGTLVWRQMMCQTQGIRLAAQVEVLLSWHRIQDAQWADLPFYKKVRRVVDTVLLRRAYRKAAAENPALERIFVQERDQANVQMTLNAKNYLLAAEPKGNLYGALYSVLATDDPNQRKSMHYIGSCIGRAAYLLDKAESFSRDKDKGRYNVFLVNGINDRNAARENARRQALAAVNDLVRAYGMLDVKLNRTLLDNIMILGLRHAIEPLGAVFPIAMFIAPAVASFLIATVCVECGKTMALTAYGAVSLLSLLFVPDKEVALTFVFLLGYYPLAKPYFERIRPALLRAVCKLLLCNGGILAMYGLVLLLVPAGSIAEELRTTALAVSLVTLAMGNVAFLLYDRALHNMLMLYHLVWQPKLHKMLGVH